MIEHKSVIAFQQNHAGIAYEISRHLVHQKRAKKV